MARPPQFFIDRSLRKGIADSLRDLGLTVHTTASVYGERTAQGLGDEVWLRDAGARGWVVQRQRDSPPAAERDALIEAGVRVFCLTSAELRGAEQIERFVTNLDRILRQASSEPGPYIYGVYKDRIERLWPK